MRAFPGLLLVLAASSALGQSPADALRGPARGIQAAELPDGHRSVVLGEPGMPNGLSLYAFAGIAGGGGPDAAKSNLYFLILNTTFVDPDEFAALLDGKRPRIRAYAIDFTAMVAATANRSEVPSPVFSETWIEAGRVAQWSARPALTKARILATFGKPAVPGSSPGAKTAGLSNVKQVALSILMYSGDFDDKYPKADSTDAARRQTMPYSKNEEIWKSPNGGRILFNTSLSNTSATALENPAETLLAWEETPYPDGSRGVGFADGHVKSVGAIGWKKVWSDELRRRALVKARA